MRLRFGICRQFRCILPPEVMLVNENQTLLLLTIRELQRISRRLRFLRIRCNDETLDHLLDQHQRHLDALISESRQLAIQRGLEPPETLWIPPIPLPFCQEMLLAQRWCSCIRDSQIRCRRALRRYPRTDAVSILCRKTIDFSTNVIAQLEGYP